MQYAIDSLPVLIKLGISFLVLLIGSITDMKTREVPDWVNYSLVASGLGINLLFSVIYSNDDFIINSIIGLAILFGIAYVMFYAGQWGGGDSKMLMGLGAMIGVDVSFNEPQFLGGFLINILFVGAFYGILWSLYLAIRDKGSFSKEFKKIISRKDIAKWKKIIIISTLLLIIISFITPTYIKILLIALAFMSITTFYMMIFVKSIEKSSMHKLVEPSKLTEGDWIVKDVKVNGKYVTGPKDLGIDKSQIRILIDAYKKRKIGKVLIKEGIPFVPSFLLAFILTLLIGNPLWFLV